MLSEEMYSVLSKIPFPTEAIAYDKLRSKCDHLDTNKFNHLLNQAKNSPCNYIFAASPLEKATLALTEKGVAEIEAYKEREENKRMVEETLKITQKSLEIAQTSLKVAKTARNVAIVSAVATIAPLLSKLPCVIDFLKSLVPTA